MSATTVHPLLPAPACLTLDGIAVRAGTIVFAVRTRATTANCPLCGHAAERVHSHYPRTLLDLPWQGNAVRIEISCRKLFCDNHGCPRRIFAEPLPEVAARYARKTARLWDALRELTYLVGGETAAKIAQRFGLAVSPDALLAALKRPQAASFSTPRVLGVDDFAFRRGHRYGTILVDLEQHYPVDLLPDRNADTLAAWLRAHPGIEVVSRDRAEVYRNGINSGAPDALQITDRWHLLKNLGDTLERFLRRHHKDLTEAAGQMATKTGKPQAEPPVVTTEPVPTRAEQERADCRQKREERYRHVHDLYAQGFTQRAIAQQTGFDPKTIRKYLNSSTCPYYPNRRCRGSVLAPFQSYLRQRWKDGCHNAATLFAEIQALGYPGRYTILRNYLRPWRARLPEKERRTTGPPPRSRSPGEKTIPAPATVRWWLLGQCTASDADTAAGQRGFVETLIGLCPEVGQFQALAQDFGRMVRERKETDLDSWLAEVQRCAVPELRGFAKGLLQDEAAVRAALSLPWSNGQTEGQVNRLKTLKRTMYGRAGFELLRARVLKLPNAA